MRAPHWSKACHQSHQSRSHGPQLTEPNGASQFTAWRMRCRLVSSNLWSCKHALPYSRRATPASVGSSLIYSISLANAALDLRTLPPPASHDPSLFRRTWRREGFSAMTGSFLQGRLTCAFSCRILRVLTRRRNGRRRSGSPWRDGQQWPPGRATK